MNTNLTELVMVIDHSGSMSSIKDDVVNGFKELMKDQAATPGEANITVVIFDNVIETVMFRAPLNTETLKTIDTDATKWFAPRGSTALYDAMGLATNKVGAALAALPEAERPAKIIFTTITDGYENCSREFTQASVRKLIEHQTSKYSWQYVFLGANQDAVFTAETMGITKDRAMTFTCSAAGVANSLHTLSRNYSSFRGVDITEAIAFSKLERETALAE